MSKPIVYVSHPVTGDPVRNAHRAIKWVQFFIEADPTRIYIAPWVAEVLAYGERPMTPEFYDRVLGDDCEVVRALDGLVLVGGHFAANHRVSDGMLREAAAAAAADIPVLDLSDIPTPEEARDFNIGLLWNTEAR